MTPTCAPIGSAALGSEYATGEMFFVDSLAAVSDTRAGLQPRGEFARLVDLLTRELTVTATHRIRRANFLDLVADSLAVCHERLARRWCGSNSSKPRSRSSARGWLRA